jgi:phage shock protein A
LQGVQRLEEHVAYLEGLLKAMGSKINAINTKETMNAITESVDSAEQCCNSSRQDVLVAG